MQSASRQTLPNHGILVSSREESTFTKKEEVKDMMKLVVMVMISIMTLMGVNTVETATVVETYDDTMLVEMHDGNIHEYTFDNMKEEEMYATTVVLVDGEVVAVR